MTMKPLDGISVLDFTREVSGPHCTQLLATLGAEVIKVEPPAGERTRNEWVDAFCSFNLGGKKSISVDLKTEDGNEIVSELAMEADVIVENFRPGVLEKFDLDYDAVSAHNEDVVYCSISGFGQDGPYRDYPAYDPIAQAMCGVMARTGYTDRPPVRIGASFIDCGTALHAALFVVAAVSDRDRTGSGRYIDVSLYDTAISWMGYSIAKYSRTGEIPERNGTGNGVTDRVYEAGDGGSFYVKVITQVQFERMCQALERVDLLEDERFDSIESRSEHSDVLRRELEETFDAYDRDRIVELLSSSGVPIGAVQSIEEVVDDPHVRERTMLTDSYDEANDRNLQTAAVPLRTDQGQVDVGDRPPGHGEHNVDVLTRLGYSAERIAELAEDGVIHGDN